MVTLTISLPDQTNAWLEARSRDSGYPSPSDYVQKLIERDQNGSPLSLDELRALVAEAKASGISSRTVDEIAAEARASVGLVG